jgi:hypothetical protein
MIAAQMHNDVHVRKMIVESGQMLSTTYRMLEGVECREPSKSGKTIQKQWKLDDPELDSVLYKVVHRNHPCTVWTRESLFNWLWHYNLFTHLCDEYTFRFGKVHETDRKLRKLLSSPPPSIPMTTAFKGFTLAMDQYPHCIVPGDVVQSYRNYYIDQKLSFTTYTKREPPEWLKPHL